MPKEILIVDDEPDVVVPIQFLMEQQGYLVLVSTAIVISLIWGLSILSLLSYFIAKSQY